MRTSEARTYLYKLVHDWAQASRHDPRDQYPYQSILDEMLFHAELRFKDYIQFQTDGEFPVRLKEWLERVPSDKQKQALFKLLQRIIFIDRLQMLSLYRDAFRRIIVSWLNRNASAQDLLSSEFENKNRSLLRSYRLFSITESFGFSDFLHINDLIGLPKPTILGEEKTTVEALLPASNNSIKGCIVFEDFVGTGKQAGNVIAELRRCSPPEWEILFVPLIILEKGLSNLLKKFKGSNVEIGPALVIPKKACIQEKPVLGEHGEFAVIRTLIKQTASRVLEKNGEEDDPPSSAFGYKGCGALVVTCHNTPNNTLPIIHHRAPDWFPLFRRIHHSKDHL